MTWVARANADSETIAPESGDCAILTGTVLADASLKSDFTGYGDLKYWIRTFELQRDAANRVASLLTTRVAPLIESNLVRVALREISNDILSAMQTGYGNTQYWISAVTQSNTTYQRAAHKLASIRQAVCK